MAELIKEKNQLIFETCTDNILGLSNPFSEFRKLMDEEKIALLHKKSSPNRGGNSKNNRLQGRRPHRVSLPHSQKQ